MLETFSKQEQCFLKGEEYEKRGLKPFYYAKDINSKGAKQYGVCESFSDFLKYYTNENEKHFYELIKTENPRRQIFDFGDFVYFWANGAPNAPVFIILF